MQPWRSWLVVWGNSHECGGRRRRQVLACAGLSTFLQVLTSVLFFFPTKCEGNDGGEVAMVWMDRC